MSIELKINNCYLSKSDLTLWQYIGDKEVNNNKFYTFKSTNTNDQCVVSIPHSYDINDCFVELSVNDNKVFEYSSVTKAIVDKLQEVESFFSNVYGSSFHRDYPAIYSKYQRTIEPLTEAYLALTTKEIQ